MNPAGLSCGSLGFSLPKQIAYSIVLAGDLLKANPLPIGRRTGRACVAKNLTIHRTSLWDSIQIIAYFRGDRREVSEFLRIPLRRLVDFRLPTRLEEACGLSYRARIFVASARAFAKTSARATGFPPCRRLSSAASIKANSSIVVSGVTGGSPDRKNRPMARQRGS
jgi:hypothetical protein